MTITAPPAHGPVSAPDPAPVPEPVDAPVPRRARGRAMTIGGGILIVAGLALRLFTKSDLWLDEALTVNIAHLPLRDLHAALKQDGAPPLYYVLLHGWMGLFGTSDLAARSFSGLASALTLPLIFKLGRRLGGERAAWGAVLLLATNPFAIRYATESRMYALVVLEVAVAMLVLLRAIDADGTLRTTRLPLVGTALSTAALLWTHYWAIYLVTAVGVVLLWRWRRCAEPGERRAAFRTGVAIAVGGVLWLPWVPTFLFQAAHTGTPWAPAPGPSALVTVLNEFAGGLSEGSRVLAVGFGILLFLGLFGTAIDGHRIELHLHARREARPIFAVAIACPAIAIVAGMLSGTAFAPRYTSVVLPPFILVAALGVATFADRKARTVVLACLGVLGIALSGHEAVRNRTQAGELSRYLNVAAEPGDVIAYCPDQLGPSTSRLLRRSFDQTTFPRGDGPYLVNWVDYDAVNDAASPAAFALDVSTRAGAHDVWLVSSTRYTTAEKSCTEVELRLSALRPAGRQVVEPKPGTYFEPAGLNRYPAPAP